MARAQGINTNATKVLGLMISNGLVALAGGLLAQYQGSADHRHGPRRHRHRPGGRHHRRGHLLAKMFRNFALKLLSAVIGAIIYYVVITVVLRLGLDYQRPEAAHRPGGGAVPGRPLLEGPLLHQARAKKEGAHHA